MEKFKRICMNIIEEIDDNIDPLQKSKMKILKKL